MSFLVFQMHFCAIFALLASAAFAMPIDDLHGEQLFSVNGKLDAILAKLEVIEGKIECGQPANEVKNYYKNDILISRDFHVMNTVFSYGTLEEIDIYLGGERPPKRRGSPGERLGWRRRQRRWGWFKGRRAAGWRAAGTASGKHKKKKQLNACLCTCMFSV